MSERDLAQLLTGREPIVMACPGSGCPGNLSDGYSAACQYCNVAMLLIDGVMPAHETVDILAMIDRGDFNA